jgi:hypothetical protein
MDKSNERLRRVGAVSRRLAPSRAVSRLERLRAYVQTRINPSTKINEQMDMHQRTNATNVVASGRIRRRSASLHVALTLMRHYAPQYAYNQFQVSCE